MGKKRKGRAAKRMKSARLRHERAQPGPMSEPLRERAVVDSAEESDSSLDSAAKDYIANIRRQDRSQAGPRPTANTSDASDVDSCTASPSDVRREEIPLEELFPSLSSVHVNSDLRYGLLGSSSSEDSSSSDSSSEDLAHSLFSGRGAEMSKGAIAFDDFMLSDEVVTEQANLSSSLKVLFNSDSADWHNFEASSVRGCIALFEVAQQLNLQPVFRRSTRSDVSGAPVACLRVKAPAPAQAAKSASLDSVSETISHAFAHRRPSYSCTLDREEAAVRSCAEVFLEYCAAENGDAPEALQVGMEGHASSRTVLAMLGNMLQCSVVFSEDKKGCVLRRSADALLSRRDMEALAEGAVRRYCWDDVSNFPVTWSSALTGADLPAVIGSEESYTRAAAVRVLRMWAAPECRTAVVAYRFRSRYWSTAFECAFPKSFGISTVASDKYTVDLYFDSLLAPEPSTMRVLTRFVDTSLRRDVRQSVGEPFSAAQDLGPKHTSLFIGDSGSENWKPATRRSGNKKKKKARGKEKGNTRLKNEYMCFVQQIGAFASQSPSGRALCTLPPCRPEFVPMLEALLCQLGYPLEVRGTHTPRLTVRGRDRHLALSTVEIEGVALRIFDSKNGSRGGGKKKGKKAKRQSRASESQAQNRAQDPGSSFSAPPLDASNRGYQLLVGKLGHDASRGLGVREQGRVEPVLPVAAYKRRGLGS